MSAVHDYADRLLDLAYGELPNPEAKELEQHVRGCSQCANALDDIKGVRRVMGALPAAKEPDAGLESLMAYAEQAARRASAGPAPSSAGWRKWLAPVLGLTAVAALGGVTLLASFGELKSPAAVMAEDKFAEKAPVAPVAMKQVVPEESPVAEAIAEDRNERTLEEKKVDAPKMVVVQLKPAPESNKSRAVAAKNMAELDQQFAGNSNMGPTGGANFGLGRGADNGLTDAKAKGKADEGGGGVAGYAGFNKDGTSTGSSIGDLSKSGARDQSAGGEFKFEEQSKKKAEAKESDEALLSARTRSRKEPADELAAAEKPMEPPPPAPLRSDNDDAYDKLATATPVADSAEAEEERSYKPAKKSATATVTQPPVDANLNLLRNLVSQAKEFRAQGNKQAAATYLRQAVAIKIHHPEHAGALILLGQVEQELGNTTAAAYAWRQAEILYPNSGTSQIANRYLQQQRGLPGSEGQGVPSNPKSAPKREKAYDAESAPASTY